jgi:succinyl-CoA synthetase beta subunit
MKIHEYQGKEILRNFGVPVPRGIPAFTVQEAVEAAQKLGGPVWVVKAQIHAGGRGKGGGVKVAKTIEDVKRIAGEILGMQLKTHQTGPEGQKVRRLYIEDGADIKNELYVSLVTDRATQKVALIASSEGGMDIEEVAHSTPEKIITEMIDPLTGITAEQSKKVAAAIGLTGASIDQAVDIFAKIYKCYMETDASLVEINPLNCDSKGNLMALDAKFNFDPNALFRHPEIVAFRDLDEEDPAEVEASKFDLAYISLDGNIGCLVNGAGLAMATMDTIKLFGGEPANFLDVGGGATAEKVTEAFKIMLKQPQGQGHSGQHLRRHHEVRHHRHRRDHRLQGREPVGAAGGAHEGHQRRAGQEAAGRIRPAHHRGRHHGRSRDEDRRCRQVRPGEDTHMSIYINKDTKVITQGITGKTGQFHTEKCQEYANGKNCFVAGVNPKKAGESIFNIPIYASVKEAATQTGATVSVIYVPPAGAAAAIWEAVEADLDMAICITEGIPVRDMLKCATR